MFVVAFPAQYLYTEKVNVVFSASPDYATRMQMIKDERYENEGNKPE